MIRLFLLILAMRSFATCQNANKTEVTQCKGDEVTSPEIQSERIAELPTYLEASSSVGEYSNITLQQETVESYLVPDSTIQVPGVGSFVGQVDMLEYTTLTNPSINKERFIILNKTVVNYTWIDADTLSFSTEEYWQINNANGEMQQVVSGSSQETVTYVPCSTKILLEVAVLDQSVAVAFQDVVFSGVTPTQVCVLAQFACPGDLFPYETLTDCDNFMRSIPMSCDDGEHLLQGNTTYCRFLHAMAATISPLVHCPHVAIDSMVCQQDTCNDQEYSEPYGEMTMVYSGDTAVLIVAFLIAVVPSIFYVFVMFSGKWQDVEQFGSHKEKLLDPEDLIKKDDVKLSVQNYSFALPSGTFLVQDVSFEAQAGDIVALMGPSGAGKTTLLKSLAKQLDGMVSGSVLVHKNGTVENDYHLSYVEQNPADIALAFPNLTVKESLISHARTVALIKEGEYAEGVKELLDNICDALSMKPFMNTKLMHLSGGQQKRWRVAKELLNRPSVLFLDEPTSGLDSTAALQLMYALKNVSKNMIIVCTIHQPSNSVMDMFTHILLLQKGGILQQYATVGKQIGAIDSLQEAYQGFKENNAYLPEDILDAIMIAFSDLDPAHKGYILAKESNRTQCNGLSLGNLGSILATSKDSKDFDSIYNTAKFIQSSASHHDDTKHELGLLGKYLELNAHWTPEMSKLLIPPWATGESHSDSLLKFCDLGCCHACLQRLNECECTVDKNAGKGQRADLLSRLSVEDLAMYSEAPINSKNSLRKILPLEKRLGYVQWLRVNEQFTLESFKGTSFVGKLVYFMGAVVNAGILALLFPQVAVDSLKTLYYFPASLLVGLSVFANLVFLNQVFVKISKEKAVLCWAYSSAHDSCGLRIVSGLLSRSAGNWVALILFFFLYYYVVGWNITNVFSRWAASFLSLKLMLDIQSVLSTAVFVYLSPSVGLGVTGGWLGWNVLFGGVLVRMGAMLVIWKYWSLYVTPFYHVINTWMNSALIGTSLDCPPSAQAGTCPGGGNLALKYFGYDAVEDSTSIIVLFSTLILYAGILLMLIFFVKPRN